MLTHFLKFQANRSGHSITQRTFGAIASVGFVLSLCATKSRDLFAWGSTSLLHTSTAILSVATFLCAVCVLRYCI